LTIASNEIIKIKKLFFYHTMEKQDLTRVMSDDLDLTQEAERISKKRSKSDDREDAPPVKEKRKAKQRKISQEEPDIDEETFAKMGEKMSDIPEDPIPRRKKIQKIEAWFATFPGKLEKLRANVDLENMTEIQLDTLLLEIKQIMGSNGGGAIGEMVPLAGLTLYEAFMVKLGINAQGISNLAFDQNFSQACKEVMLEYSDMTYIPPHYRILFYLANATYALHEKNSTSDNKKPKEGPAPSDLRMDDKEIIEAGKNYLASKNSKN